MTRSVSFDRVDRQSEAAITAATVAQATGVALTGTINVVTTALGETAVVLPSDRVPGQGILVRVASATAGLLFPPLGGSINGAAANASLSVAQNKPALCLVHANGIDYTVVVSA